MLGEKPNEHEQFVRRVEKDYLVATSQYAS